jgi:hypothetical protein
MKLTVLVAGTLIALTAPALAHSTTNANVVVVADGSCSSCAIQQPEGPAILPALPIQTLADGGNCSGCAVEQPDGPTLPQTPEDGAGGCSTCAIPTLPKFKVADGCTGC